jgi:hypothetical protein
MNPKGLSRSNLLLLLVLLAVSLGGCSWEEFSDNKSRDWSYRLFSWDSKTNTGNSRILKPGTYPVDSIFTDFYETLGGEAILGPAISNVETSDGLTKQYTEAGLMIFDPTAAESSRFALAPLGVELGTGEGDLLGKAYATGRIINGYLIISEFLVEYERLGGARFVGKPIGEAIYNAKKRRIEQYFENLGFFQLEGESRIHLMPYGAYACDRKCRNQEPIAGIPVLQSILPDTFLKKTLELGLPFVGKPLTGVHFTPDGKQEVIFENLVLFADMETSPEVRVRPIADQIGDFAEDPAKSQNSPLNVFYETADGFGYDVPMYFAEFLEDNGGTDIAGDPISHVFSPQPGIYWQCFTNLCLQFNLNVEGDERLRPVPLGVEYKDLHYDEVIDFQSSQALENLEMKVWEEESFVTSHGTQVIHLALFEGRKPLKNFEPILLVTMPDGSQRKAHYEPSDENGRTSIGLAPIDAPSGTLIAYKVCLFTIDGEPRCVGDNYLIWNSD